MKQIFWIAIIIGLCIVTVPLSADLLDDAVGIWLFDEGKGGVAADTSGNGTTGQLPERNGRRQIRRCIGI